MRCIYCLKEIDTIQAYNDEFKEYFENLGINSYKPYETLPEFTTEVQCSCGAWNKLED